MMTIPDEFIGRRVGCHRKAVIKIIADCLAGHDITPHLENNSRLKDEVLRALCDASPDGLDKLYRQTQTVENT